MYDITVVRCFDTRHQNTRCGAMLEGLRRIGLKVDYIPNTRKRPSTKLVAIWGWRHAAYLRGLGHEILVMELGYIGDRRENISLGWNGLNGYAEFPAYAADDGGRFKSHGGALKPWKKAGDYALILGQLPGDSSLKGNPMQPIYEQWAEQIDIPVLFRNHPEAIRRNRAFKVSGTIPSTGTLEEALQGAAFSVCFNSNSSVDSVLAGVPCIVMDEGSMAYPVCGHAIGEIIRPRRERWAYDLAFKQWTMDEIARGLPLHKLLEGRFCFA